MRQGADPSRSVGRAAFLENVFLLFQLFLTLAALLQSVVDTLLDLAGRHGNIGEILTQAVPCEDDFGIFGAFLLPFALILLLGRLPSLGVSPAGGI